MASGHKRPSTPGWQLFVNACEEFSSDNCTRLSLALFEANLRAREHEKIPEPHFDVVMKALLQATFVNVERGDLIRFPQQIVHFFDTQMGREDLTAFLQEHAPDWEVVEYDGCGRGYAVQTKDAAKVQERERRATEQKQLLEDMFGPFDMSGTAVLLVGGITGGRPNEPTTSNN